MNKRQVAKGAQQTSLHHCRRQRNRCQIHSLLLETINILFVRVNLLAELGGERVKNGRWLGIITSHRVQGLCGQRNTAVTNSSCFGNHKYCCALKTYQPSRAILLYVNIFFLHDLSGEPFVLLVMMVLAVHGMHFISVCQCRYFNSFLHFHFSIFP